VTALLIETDWAVDLTARSSIRPPEKRQRAAPEGRDQREAISSVPGKKNASSLAAFSAESLPWIALY
jgi:hypothetical protein